MTFEFATAGRVLCGVGALRGVPGIVREWGRRFLVVTGRSALRVRPLVEALESAGLEPRLMSIPGEPTVELVERGCALVREQRVEGVLALGGGSAIDAGKAIAGVSTQPGALVDHLEVVGRGLPLTKAGLPFLAIPTTAGTGAEVTRNAVLASAEHQVKVSLRSHSLLPRVAVLDPELSYRLSPRLTAATGLDALTQLIEPFVSCRANPITDGLCREGIRRVAQSLRAAHAVAERIAAGSEDPLSDTEKEARADMAMAACMSGMALANAGLGVVHGFAGPIGGMFPAPHGEVCAALLAEAMAGNLAALQVRDPKGRALARYREVGRLLYGHEQADARDALVWIRALVTDLGVNGLRAYGVSETAIPLLVEKSRCASSMKGNPVELTTGELAGVLRRAL